MPYCAVGQKDRVEAECILPASPSPQQTPKKDHVGSDVQFDICIAAIRKAELCEQTPVIKWGFKNLDK